MTKEREIVLMLILRKRLARRLHAKHENRLNDKQGQYLYGQYIEAANAAELARRILYKEE